MLLTKNIWKRMFKLKRSAICCSASSREKTRKKNA